MAQVLVRGVEDETVNKLKEQAQRNGRSLQAELKSALKARASHASKAEARALAARIRRRVGKRPQTDSGILQAEGRAR